MSRPPQSFGMPPMSDRTKQILAALLGLYILEFILAGAGLPLERLTWDPLTTLVAPWSPFTRMFVQGPQVLSVLLGLLVLFFMAPAMEMRFTDRQVLEALGAVWVGSTLLPLAGAMALGHGGVLAGWQVLIVAIICLFALSDPEQTVLLYFVIPVRAVWFLYAAIGIPSFFLIVAVASGAGFASPLQYIGAWLGVVGWWRTRGPMAPAAPAPPPPRRTRPRFDVIEGGKSE